jgi:hypothetical protein
MKEIVNQRIENPMILPEKFKQLNVPKWRDTALLLEGYKIISYKENFKPRKGYEDYDTPYKEVLDVRIFYTKGSRTSMGSNKVLIWVRGGQGRFGHSHGVAGGCGYHRTSAALSSALRNLGIKLGDFDCSGVGDDAMKRACMELCRQLGYSNLYLVHFYR